MKNDIESRKAEALEKIKQISDGIKVIEEGPRRILEITDRFRNMLDSTENDLDVEVTDQMKQLLDLVVSLSQQNSEYAVGYLKASLKGGIDEAICKVQKKVLLDKQAKINRYKNGPTSRSEESYQKWELAKQYLLEEVPRHKTLIAARKAAAARAGIKVNDRRLIEKLPFRK